MLENNKHGYGRIKKITHLNNFFTNSLMANNANPGDIEHFKSRAHISLQCPIGGDQLFLSCLVDGQVVKGGNTVGISESGKSAVQETGPGINLHHDRDSGLVNR